MQREKETFQDSTKIFWIIFSICLQGKCWQQGRAVTATFNANLLNWRSGLAAALGVTDQIHSDPCYDLGRTLSCLSPTLDVQPTQNVFSHL
jgi:hypothetical protein